MERLSSGRPRLDHLLGGGFPRDGINLIVGLPGSGKTILAQQYVFHNATRERPALYLTTVSEPLEKVVRYGQTLSFFDPAAVGRSVFFEDLGGVLDTGGLDAVMHKIKALVRERHPSIVVIDSFKALHPFSHDERQFRAFLHGLAGTLTAFPATSFWLGEYGRDDVARAAEFAVADSIVSLSMAEVGERTLREVEVLKLRGSGFASGRHAYRVSRDGLDVFPRLADTGQELDYRQLATRQSSGVDLLDAMLSDGYWPGASTLVAGPSGSGKTLLGLHFLFAGAADGERGIIATLQENPIQLARIVQGYGWDLDDPNISLMYRSPVDLYIDEWYYDLVETIERTGAKRVLIDSLGDLKWGSPDVIRFREYVYSLSQRTAHDGVSVIMTLELAELFGASRLSEDGLSHVSDNVLVLQYARREERLARVVTVLKTRASRHDASIREFEITDAGFEILATVDV
jgi:circadian clock protein KaiC